MTPSNLRLTQKFGKMGHYLKVSQTKKHRKQSWFTDVIMGFLSNQAGNIKEIDIMEIGRNKHNNT